MQTSAKPTKTADFLTLFQIIPASLYAFRKRIKQKPLLFLLDWVAIPLLFVTFLGFWDKDGTLAQAIQFWNRTTLVVRGQITLMG